MSSRIQVRADAMDRAAPHLCDDTLWRALVRFIHPTKGQPRESVMELVGVSREALEDAWGHWIGANDAEVIGHIPSLLAPTPAKGAEKPGVDDAPA